MKNKPYLLIALGVIVIAVVGYLLFRSQSEGASQVRIAGNIPLTGPIAAFSGGYANGFKMGVGEASADLGLNPGTFSIDFQDNAGEARTAVTVLQKQLMESPEIYFSGTTQMTEALLPRLDRTDAMHFLVSFDAFMTRDSPRTFRILPNFKIEAPVFFRFVHSKGAKKVFFVTPNLKAYLEQSDRLILPSLEKAGIDYQRELFEFQQGDYRPIAQKAKLYNPDVIVVSGYAFHVYPALKALREQGLVESASVIAALDFIDLLHNDTPRDDLKGVAFVAPHCEIPGKVPAYADWKTRYKQHYGKEASYVDAYAYDTGRIIARAYAQSHEISEAAVRGVLPFDGVVGPIDLDADRDLTPSLVVGRVGPDATITELPLD